MYMIIARLETPPDVIKVFDFNNQKRSPITTLKVVTNLSTPSVELHPNVSEALYNPAEDRKFQ